MANLLMAGVGAAAVFCMAMSAQAQTTARYVPAGTLKASDAWKKDLNKKVNRDKDEVVVIILDTTSGQLFFCGDDSKDCEPGKPLAK